MEGCAFVCQNERGPQHRNGQVDSEDVVPVTHDDSFRVAVVEDRLSGWEHY